MKTEMKFKSYFRKNRTFFVFLCALLAMRWSFADQYQVPSGSMEPTIHVGDRILVDKLAYQFKIPFTDWILFERQDPRRGEIVVFESPVEGKITMVKRLIGLPGDRISIRDGFITINGRILDGALEAQMEILKNPQEEFFYNESVGEAKVQIKRLPFYARTEHLDFQVPEGHYFMMGDNRDNSRDSRSWGFVPRENLKGRALRVLWNLSFHDWIPTMELDRFGRAL